MMAGSPIKHEKQRIVREAIMLALQRDGMTPEQALAPMMKKQVELAEEGDTHAAAFIADRLDGKPAQQVQLSGDAEAPIRHRIEQVIVDPQATQQPD